jgi:hypothetical protein
MSEVESSAGFVAVGFAIGGIFFSILVFQHRSRGSGESASCVDRSSYGVPRYGMAYVHHSSEVHAGGGAYL